MTVSQHDPLHFNAAARTALADERLQAVLKNATGYSLQLRDEVVADFAEWEAMRDAAHSIRRYAIDHLAELLETLTHNCERNGVQVHFAATADSACHRIVEILQRNDVRTVVKSKSMTGEEIALNAALAQAGIEAVETDLGEYIVQLEGTPPSHITAPALHLSRQQIGALFAARLGIPYTDDPEALTATARTILREKFLAAGASISGVNFACADTGRLVIVENEGNARLATSLPRIHIALCGIEKVIAHERDVALLLRMLARSATGQRLNVYTNFLSHPRTDGEGDGPDEMHLVLLDNGRSRMLADAGLRESLLCIRCGACLNACPVYQRAGGHAYGSAYMGPIGAVVTPQLMSLRDAAPLPFASTLCGECSEICPVKIPLPQHLLTLRARIAERERLRPKWERAAMATWAAIMLDEERFERASRWFARLVKLGFHHWQPGWTPEREPLSAPPESFRTRWLKMRGAK